MITTPSPVHRRYTSIFALGLLALLNFGCGDDSKSTGGGNQNQPVRVTIPLDSALVDVPLLANQTTTIPLALYLPPGLKVVDSVEIDVAATMEHVEASLSGRVSALKRLALLVPGQAVAQAIVRISDNPETVCDEGAAYGPYQITATSLGNPDPENIALAGSSMEVINAGTTYLCLEIVSTEDAMFSLDEVEALVTQHDCDFPANLAGLWLGTYQCGNSCGEPFGGDVDLTITQTGTTASYTDGGGDVYNGYVCGNQFRFERIDPDEIERGTLTLIDANHAVKRSTWRGRTFPFCHGNCLDTLVRAEAK